MNDGGTEGLQVDATNGQQGVPTHGMSVYVQFRRFNSMHMLVKIQFQLC